MSATVVTSDKAAILLHEIYGVNDFIKLIAERYREMGIRVFIYDTLGGESFTYKQADEAYRYVNQKIGFDIYLKVEIMIKKLKKSFKTVFLVGFSVGATVAWRCCESPFCDGIICHYGSRIRDYSELKPTCPVLAIFAERDSFDVGTLAETIGGSPMVHILRVDGHHGFMDPYSSAYDENLAEKVYGWIGIKIGEIFHG